LNLDIRDSILGLFGATSHHPVKGESSCIP
jgi:hypothetical protein